MNLDNLINFRSSHTWLSQGMDDAYDNKRTTFTFFVEILQELGFELYTGCGGFYHWGLLPNGLTADEFNERLFNHDAGILPGYLCDMTRDDDSGSPLDKFIRFSFGPLEADTFENDMQILSECV